ncbi:MAG: GAF domain-containing protein [Anaerolineae bacterium]|nr:GAF domain-containing protein [Anaerolineae bacterium]
MSNLDKPQRLRFLYQAACAISEKLNLDEVLQQLMTLTHQHFQPDAVSVALVEKDGSMIFRAASGKSAKEIIGLRMAPGSGIVGWVAQHGEPLWVPDAYADARFYREADQKTGFYTKAILAAPVRFGEQTLAVVEMLNPKASDNLDENQEMLTTLAALAARPIQNAQLFEQVQRTEARYENLFEENFDPIIIIDDEGNLLESNQAAKLLLALPPAAAPTFDLKMLNLSREDFEALKQRLTLGEVIVREFDSPGTDGNRRNLEMYFSHLPDYPPDGAYQWIAHDITDRVALEEMRQNLSHMIVHDLRAPLGSILNSLELLLTIWQDHDFTLPAEQVIKIGLRSAHRMERLISTILDTARLQSNEKTLALSTIAIPDIIAETLEVVQSAAKKRQQHIFTRLVPDLPAIEADPDLLRRVLINIVSNAIKYIQDGGVIEVNVTEEAEETLFIVSDNGPGISAEDQVHIFDTFFRGKTRQAEGAGLGLAFCKLAVEAHGGKIWLKSEVGKGATFYFTIPHQIAGGNSSD